MADNLSPLQCRTSRKSRALTYPEPLGPPQPVARHLYFFLFFSFIFVCSHHEFEKLSSVSMLSAKYDPAVLTELQVAIFYINCHKACHQLITYKPSMLYRAFLSLDCVLYKQVASYVTIQQHHLLYGEQLGSEICTRFMVRY